MKGSFTGAFADRAGKFEQADGGTLFLDEVGDMSLSAQAKLLRVLQEGVVTRIGGSKSIQVDVRVLAATNKDLEGEIAEQPLPRGPALPARTSCRSTCRRCASGSEDVPALVAHFAEQLAASAGVPGEDVRAPTRSSGCRRAPWPGNIRELRNAVERALILAPGKVVTGGRHRPAAAGRTTAVAGAAPRPWPRDVRGVQAGGGEGVPDPTSSRARLERRRRPRGR